MTTIKDVARASGVSSATVSQVLGNGKRPVNEETRRRVLQVAQQLDYRPNALARGLVGKRMNTIGVVFTQWGAPQTNQFMMELLAGVLAANGRRRQNTMLFTVDSWNEGTHRLSELCDGRCDGIVLMVPPAQCPLLRALQERQVPCVSIGSLEDAGQMPTVDVDNARAAFAMTSALIEMGHRNIAFVGPNHDFTGFIQMHERQQGYREALSASGAYNARLDNIAAEVASSLTVQSESKPPTAFFCAFDQVALRLMGLLENRGVRVPDDVSVAGFDDIPSALVSQPALSTVRQPARRLGERAAEKLLSLIEGSESGDRNELLPTELVLRSSTGPPPLEA